MPLEIISNILGANAQNDYLERQFKYDKKTFKFNYDQSIKDFDWRVKDNAISRQNIDNNARYSEATAVNDYKNTLAIRNFEYGNQVRQFNESERIYGLQLGFNNQAAGVAYEAEQRRFQETLTGMAFDQQDMLVKMLQEEGSLQASGVSGRSAGKALAASMASYGRNQAIAAESLVSATKESNVSKRQIATEKHGADLSAQSRRMLKPLLAPAPLAPLSMPRATILDPRRPEQGPMPIKGAKASVFGAALSGLSSDIGNVLSIAGMSDIRLKEDIQHIGVSDSGHNIYEWNYIWGGPRYRGVMAQEILRVMPEAVRIFDGYLAVLYDLIDVNMELVT